MFGFLKNSLINLTGQPAKRSAIPARQRRPQLRVESLESRSMLAFTLISVDTNYGFTLQAGGNSLITNNYERELELPRTEISPEKIDGGQIPIPSEPWVPDTKPVPPTNSTPPVPDAVPGAIPEDPTDPGGMVDLGPETEPEGSTGVSPYEEPSPRELRSVIELLAGLKYAVGSSESPATFDSKFSDVEQHVRRLESALSEADGGAVSIAVSEIADELDAARTEPNMAPESLLEISVQMDRSAGRFQAFEVLTLEEAAPPTAEVRPTATPQPPANPAAVNFEAADAADSAELPVQTSSRQIGGNEPGAEVVGTEGAAPVAIADEKSSSTWSLTVALVTFGFVLQLLRDRHGELLQAHAASLWQSLLAITYWKPRRRKQRQTTSPPQ